MPAKYPWFERTYMFDFPASKYPDIVERLRGAPVRVEEKIAALESRDILTRRDGDSGGGGWSIQENVGHLLDLEPMWSQRTEDILGGADVMTAADLTNMKTHEANHNANSIQQLMNAFRADREQWLARLDELEEADFARSSNHPRLGTPMRLVDLCHFVAEHDDCHLARMTELGRMFARQGEPA